MIDLTDIKTIEFNITNLCNAKCPLCVRTIMIDDNNNGRGTPFIKKSIEPELYESIAVGLGEHSKNIEASFCGTTGDAINHPDIDEIIDISQKYYKKLWIESNASVKSEDWWRQLGNKRVRMRFAIDGLSDTNGLYRINTNYEKIMANAQAFLDAGGLASWKFIIFDHNEHQVEEARELAKRMGFKNFVAVPSIRFRKNEIKVKPDMYRARINQVNDEIKKQGFVIKPSTKVNSSVVEQYKKNDATLKSEQDVEISCRTSKEGYLFVDHWGKLWPCCYWGASDEIKDTKWNQWYNKWQGMYGEDFNQLSIHNNIRDMLEHDLFKRWLPDSFDQKHDKCTVCILKCVKGKLASNKENIISETQMNG